jgi:hypothetical protein
LNPEAVLLFFKFCSFSCIQKQKQELLFPCAARISFFRLNLRPALVSYWPTQVTDQGSQFVAAAVEAAPGEVVLDLCAGNGGKALALASAMHAPQASGGTGGGRVVCFDVAADRLKQLRGSLGRAGLSLSPLGGQGQGRPEVSVEICWPAAGADAAAATTNGSKGPLANSAKGGSFAMLSAEAVPDRS